MIDVRIWINPLIKLKMSEWVNQLINDKMKGGNKRMNEF